MSSTLGIQKRGMQFHYSWESLLTPPTQNRKTGHFVRVEKTPEWLAAREAFVEKWEATNSEGLEQGFLEADYEGTYPTTHNADSEWVEDEA